MTPTAPTPGGNPSHLGFVSGAGTSSTGAPSPAAPHHRAKPSGPTVNQVVKTLSSVAGVAGQVLWQAIDLVFNVSGMWHDVQTLTDDNANWWAKAAALADLGVTIFTDINMLVRIIRPRPPQQHLNVCYDIREQFNLTYDEPFRCFPGRFTLETDWHMDSN